VNIVVSGVTSTNDIIPALDALLKKADVLYLPTDNLIASSMPIISEKCIAKKVPVIGAEKGLVEGGALATEGIDYYKLGFQTGLAAVEVLNGKKPEDIPITTLQDTELVVNKTTLNKLGISLPSDLAGRAVMVEGGGKK
jgi:putative ABC transport system substrate-binding protein